jgi:hypothetical protein
LRETRRSIGSIPSISRNGARTIGHVAERYVEGAISWPEVHNALVSLGFRDSALKIELLELNKARARQGYGAG